MSRLSAIAPNGWLQCRRSWSSLLSLALEERAEQSWPSILEVTVPLESAL